MKLYKRQIRVYSVDYLGQGFAPNFTVLTDWLDEEEGEAEFKRLSAEAKQRGWSYSVYDQERFEIAAEM